MSDVTQREATWDGQRWYLENAWGEGNSYYWSWIDDGFWTQDAGTKGYVRRGPPLIERDIEDHGR